MTIQTTMSLYHCLTQAQIPVSNHESDLYFPVTPGTTTILSQFPLQQKNATTFIDNVTGKRWYDVPFSYEVSPEE